MCPPIVIPDGLHAHTLHACFATPRLQTVHLLVEIKLVLLLRALDLSRVSLFEI